jgi:hypothetical protein
MPIRPENADRYPADWPQIRQQVLERARHRCEACDVENHALGGRTKGGLWLPALPLGEKMLSLEWPRPGSWAFCGHLVGEIEGKRHYVGEELRIIRIVLTIAHLDHTPENCALDNLRSWCQRCHLAYDAAHHAQTAYATRRAGRALGDLFDAEFFA